MSRPVPWCHRPPQGPDWQNVIHPGDRSVSVDLDRSERWILGSVLCIGILATVFSYYAGLVLRSGTMIAFGVLFTIALVILAINIKHR